MLTQGKDQSTDHELRSDGKGGAHRSVNGKEVDAARQVKHASQVVHGYPEVHERRGVPQGAKSPGDGACELVLRQVEDLQGGLVSQSVRRYPEAFMHAHT